MNGQSQPQVFLSYAHADQARVAKLAEALSAAGLKVWWDTALETGSRFSKDIERELNAADAVLVVWSAASVASAWVLDEAGHGRDSGRLVPVRIDDTVPPLGFRQYQATDLSAWKGRAADPKFQAVVAAIQKLAGGAAPGSPAPAVAATTSGPSRRTLFGGIAGVAVLAAGGFGAWKAFGGKGDDGTASVAVLPFANLSGDPAQTFFSDGIAEELRNALSQIRGLTVIGRVSSEQFRDAKDMSEVAAKLGVDHVLTGSVRRSPTTIRIGAQLVDGRTGAETWSQSFDEPVGDALVVQSKIASNVLAALSQRLGQSVGTVAVGGTTNVAAQELFLKAQALQKADISEANSRSSLALLDAAIALDPRYAEAHALRGRVLGDFANGAFGPGAARLGYQQKDAMAAARRAVALAPTSGLARISLAGRYLDDPDLRSAVAEGEAALRLAPDDSRVLSSFSTIVRGFDPGRAVDLARRALVLDPLNASVARGLARNQLFAGRYADAEATSREALGMSDSQVGAESLAEALLRLGRYDEARQVLQKITPEWYRLTFASILEARAGNRAAADAALAAVRAIDDGTMHYQFAQIYTARGETAKALDEIEAALRTKDPGLADVAVDPAFDSIRREPRFKAVQDKLIPPDLFVPPKRG